MAISSFRPPSPLLPPPNLSSLSLNTHHDLLFAPTLCADTEYLHCRLVNIVNFALKVYLQVKKKALKINAKIEDVGLNED